MKEENKVITTADFITRLADKGYTKKDSAVILGDVLEVAYEAIQNGEEIHIIGFGSLSAFETKPKRVMNISTGKVEDVAPYMKIRFKPGLALKRAAEKAGAD